MNLILKTSFTLKKLKEKSCQYPLVKSSHAFTSAALPPKKKNKTIVGSRKPRRKINNNHHARLLASVYSFSRGSVPNFGLAENRELASSDGGIRGTARRDGFAPLCGHYVLSERNTGFL